MKLKKFIIFLIIVIGALSIGLTTYYFVRNNEVISIQTKQVYCNLGDEISVSSLGIKIKNKNTGKKTTFNYNAGGKDVTDLIKYDSKKKSYVVNNVEGGVVDVVISTTNKKQRKLQFKVFIGAGTTDDPYYIKNQQDLSKIGKGFDINKAFLLMADIELDETFDPIGYNQDSNSVVAFNGHFNGNSKTISNLNLTKDYGTAGLFAEIGSSAVVEDLKVASATILGNNSRVGALAGISAGKIKRVSVVNANILTTANNYNVGALAGLVSGDVELSYVDQAKLEVCASSGYVGGFAGVQDRSTVVTSYVNNVEIIGSNSLSVAGGFVGQLKIGSNSGRIVQSYANATSDKQSFSGFIGEMIEASDLIKILIKCYAIWLVTLQLCQILLAHLRFQIHI